MAVNYVKGQILSGILERDGIDISIANANVGINTITPTVALDVNGNIRANNLSIVNNVSANTANITGNVVVGNISTAGNVATGNLLTDNLFYANGVPWDLEKPAGNTTEIQFNDNDNFGANVNFTFDATGNLLTVNATANIANVNVAGNVAGGNILTTGIISATGNLTAGNVGTDGNVYGNNLYGIGIVSTTGNVIAGNIQTGGEVTATGNITGGNILTVGVVSTTGNVQGAFILGNGFYLTGVANSETANRLVNGTSNVDIPVANGNVIVGVGGSSNIVVVATSGQYITGVNSVSGNIIGGNLITDGAVSATFANLANLHLANTTITTDGTIGNVVLQPTGTGIVYVNTTTGIAVPVGNTAQRPSPATTGTVRFNSTFGRLEVYDGTEWDAVVAGVTNQILYGDGSTTAFTLNRSTTTAAALVILNGITQVPDQAYSMVPNPSANLVFTEAPQTSDIIDIRFL